MEEKMNNLCVELYEEKRAIHCIDRNDKLNGTRDERETIVLFLNRLGIPRNTAGYNYLYYIILKIIKTNIINIKLTTELYPQIAVELNSSVNRIERGLRYSIESAWDRNKEVFKSVLGYYNECKPYSSEFIWLLADKIRMFE
ncbi:MAG: sporulation initiation factor Spo0A C-terminal domain-containing protein [Ruminococcus sp.]|nr:sporulation initiation factor Spo0A C-terminal domain-containing protein [Ruminococcus sp.]